MILPIILSERYFVTILDQTPAHHLFANNSFVCDEWDKSRLYDELVVVVVYGQRSKTLTYTESNKTTKTLGKGASIKIHDLVMAKGITR